MTLRRFTHRTKKDEDWAEEIESHLAHEQDANAALNFQYPANLQFDCGDMLGRPK